VSGNPPCRDLARPTLPDNRISRALKSIASIDAIASIPDESQNEDGQKNEYCDSVRFCARPLDNISALAKAREYEEDEIHNDKANALTGHMKFGCGACPVTIYRELGCLSINSH
jgi:hypothetical protein